MENSVINLIIIAVVLVLGILTVFLFQYISNSQINRFINAFPFPVFIVRRNGKILMRSKITSNFFEDEMVGKVNIYNFLRSFNSEAGKLKNVFELDELRINLDSSKLNPVEMTLSVFPISLSNKKYCLCFNIDKDKVVDKGMDNYKHLLTNYPHPVIISDKQNQVIWSNMEFVLSFGYELGTEDKLKFSTLFQPGQSFSSIDILNEVNKSGSYFYTSRWLTKNGQIRTVKAKTCTLNFQDSNYTVTYITDISEKLAAENKLQHYITLMKEANEIAQISFWNYNLTNDSFDWYTGTSGILPVHPESVSCMNELLNMIHIEDRDWVKSRFFESFSKESSNDVIFRAHSEKDSIQMLHMRIISDFDKNGFGKGAHGTIQNITDQAIAIEAIKEIEERYKITFDNAPVGILNIDFEGNILKVNREFEQISAYNSDELLGVNLIQLTDTAHKTWLENVLNDLQEKKNENSLLEIRIKNKHDNHIWLQLNLNVFSSKYEDVSYIIVIAENISKRKHYEHDLKRLNMELEQQVNKRTGDLREAVAKLELSENRFKQLAKLLPQTVFEMDLTGKFTFANEQGLEMNGYSMDDLKNGLSVTDIAVQSEIPRMKENMKNIAEGKSRKPNEYLIRRKNGEVYPARIYSTPVISEGKPVGFRGILIDISETRMVQDELEVVYQALKSNPEGVIIIDDNGFIFFANNLVEQKHGFADGELKNKHFEQLFSHPKAHEQYKKIIFAISKRQDYTAEYINYDSKGKVYWELVIMNPVRKINQIDYFILVLVDITTQKKSEEELRKAKEIADQANKSKSMFLANTSHEIRTPLNSIIGFTDILRSEISNDQQVSYLDSIKNSSRNLLNLLNDILDLSKIEAGKLKFKYSYFNVANLIEEIKKSFYYQLNQKKLQLNIDISDNLPSAIYFDELRLRQILMNLVSNAIKFTNEGFISISAACTNIFPVGNSSTIELQFIVEDTGIGIDKDQQTKIFGIFEQGDNLSNRKYEGSGLGLAISLRLIEHLNGTINLQSEVNKGSKFTINFVSVNAKNEFKPITKKTETRKKLNFHGASVLVVDDIFEDRYFFNSTLRSMNLKVHMAENGNEAMDMVHKVKPTLIITDLKMPVSDGFDLVNKIKSIEEFNAIPVIATSASVLNDTMVEVNKHRFDGFLPKPINYEKLTKILENNLLKSSRELAQNNKQVNSELITKLENELIPIYSDLKENQAFDVLEEFSTRLKLLGNEYKCTSLIEFGENLKSAVDKFDIESILEELKLFPKLMNELKTEAS